MSDRMVEVHYKPGEEVVLRFRPPKLREVLPLETAKHAREAAKEMLLGMRSLIDVAVQSLETKEPPKGKTRIKVE